MTKTDTAKPRCPWCLGSAAYIRYHDREWGHPVHDERALLEFLILEGAQAGLSWSTILAKRGNYRRAFSGYVPAKLARFGARDVKRLLADAGIVRNRLKIQGAIKNAQSFIGIREEFGTFDKYIWSFVDGEPIRNRWKTLQQVPANTTISEAMSKDLRKRGFTFVGSTICYAFMQAVGMVNDHTVNCFRHGEIN
ncbi:MAG: DNA-3-methyladenine glycosylase [Gammaproteobacteria bacterium RIFCSPLOWO2_12_47_11]|nr:MAG: DNA-3-methyladenine glycosylase [Gammaproteobacteria bacterium RIFCSPLOWO2_12_47_11]